MKVYSIVWMLSGENFQLSWFSVNTNNVSENCGFEIFILFFGISD